VWQDAYPPAICVRILEICRVKQSVLGFLCTYVCPTISTALKVFGPKKYERMFLVYLKSKFRKNMSFPGIENLSKIIHFEKFLSKNM
jgi:hypothetical protein